MDVSSAFFLFVLKEHRPRISSYTDRNHPYRTEKLRLAECAFLSSRNNDRTLRSLSVAALTETSRAASACFGEGGLHGEGSVAGEGHEGERVSIVVVAEVEDAGEAGAGEFGFVPGAVSGLCGSQVFNAFSDGWVGVHAGGHQAHEGPRSL